MSKPTLLYIIDSLGRGGAETLLVGILKDVSKNYDIVLVTLNDVCEFNEDDLDFVKRFQLGFKGKFSYLACVWKLRKIIRQTRPALLHGHLLNSSIILRMASPAHIPIVISLHSILSWGAFNGSWMYRNLEKKLFSKKHFIIAVSNDVLKDYEAHIGTPTNKYILKNFVGDEFVEAGNVRSDTAYEKELKLVSVGNVKKVKNYEYLLDAFGKMRNKNVSLDIYGNGDSDYMRSLQQRINEDKLPVRFMGPHREIYTVLSGYNFFVMSSTQEGFGIAAVEAMAAGLPLLLSDIAVLRDITYNNALFFDLNNPNSLIDIIEQLKEKRNEVIKLIQNGKKIVQDHYTRQAYVDRLFDIYNEVLKDS